MDAPPSSWVLEILRFALNSTASTSLPWDSEPIPAVSATGADDPLTDPKDPGNDPRFRKLVEAILFGRRFLKTYNLVLLGVLLVFTTWHWGEKYLLHRRARRQATGKNSEASSVAEDAWSSSSSTIEGSATPPEAATQTKLDDADETSPLIPTGRPQRKTPGLYKPYYLLKSFLQYQPRPIPIINKTLPTNVVSLFVLAYLGLTVFYNFYRMPLELMYLFVFADRCGIIIISNLPLLYLLAAKNQPIKLLTGYSYESLNIFHRRVGEVVCFQALLHFLGMLSFWWGLLRRLGFTLMHFIFNRVVLLGLLAFICYEVIYFTSLGSFRQRWYEIFLAIHIILQVGGLVFLFFHHHTSRPYVLISAAIFLIDRLAFRLWLKSSSHPATISVLEDDETVFLSSNWEVSKSKSALAPENMKHGWQPNDHIFITVPALSRKQALQAHPFTIFSAAPTMTINEEGRHAWFSLLIRAQSEVGFTKQLLNYARSHPSIHIRLDGPYGSSHALDVLKSSSTTILVAGGSGIAVAYPVLYSLLQPTLNDPESGIPRSSRKVKLLWITHSPSHRLWIPKEKLKELEEWGLDVLTPPPTALAGRPDVQSVIEGWIESESGQSGVVVSGPDGLVRDVRNTCALLIRRGENVKVQVEKFGW